MTTDSTLDPAPAPIRRMTSALFPGINDFDGRWRGLAIGLFWTVILLWLLTLIFMVRERLGGDEVVYFRSAKTIAQYLVGDGITLDQLRKTVVGFGWFMPGISIALTPIFILVSDPSVAVVRIYASAITFMMWLVTLRSVHRTLGPSYSLGMMIFPSLVLVWLCYFTALWADLMGGLFITLLFLATIRLTRTFARTRTIALWDLVVWESLATCSVYLRGNAIAAVFALHVFLAFLALVSLSFRRVLAVWLTLFLGGLLFLATLLPWSHTASRVMGDTVITTSTVPLSLAVTFGNTENLCFGPCPRPDNIWIGAMVFATKHGDKHDVSPLTVVRKMSRKALKGLTLDHYLQTVRQNFRRFLFLPDAMFGRFIDYSDWQIGDEARAVGVRLNGLWTHLLYMPFLFSLFAVNLIVLRRGYEDQVISILLKLLTAAYLVQPLIHVSHSRYWPTFGILMSVAGVFLVRRLYDLVAAKAKPAAAAGGAGAAAGIPGIDGSLFAVQLCYAVAFSVAAIAILAS